jgi:multiple sugar transport system substrate-binding protein
VAPLPAGPKGRITPFNGLAHVVSSGTKSRNEAWKLASFMDGAKGESIISSFAVVFPSVKSALPTYLKAFEGKAPANIHYYTDAAAGKTGPYPQHLKWGQIWDIVNQRFDSAFSGDITVQQAIASAKADVDPLLQ